jgi:hypothetical protein
MTSFANIMRNQDMSKQAFLIQEEANSGGKWHGMWVVVLDVILTFVEMN